MITVAVGGATKTTAFARQFRKVKNDVGTITFTLLRGSADAAGVGLTLARCLVTATNDLDALETKAVQGRLGPTTLNVIAHGEEADEHVVVAINDVLATLADAVVYPHANLGILADASTTRQFNFASLDYVEAGGWVNAVEQGPWRNFDGFPIGWPTPDARFIWSNAAQGLGDSYFRASFTAAEADHIVYLTADDTWVLYIDGQKMGAGDKYFGLADTFQISTFLNAGPHVIAGYCTNQYPSFAHLLVAVYQRGLHTDTLVLQSDSTWRALPYPATPPGFTAGAILKILLDEALARGGLTVAAAKWTYDFSATLDSNGNAWAGTAANVEIGFGLGEDYLNVVRKLCETHIDIAVDANGGAGPILRAFNKGGLDHAPAIALVEGVHLLDLTLNGEPISRGVVLVHDAHGVYSEVDSGLVGVDRREVFLDVGSAPSAATAATMAQGALKATAPGPVAVRATVVSVDEAVPLFDFDVGDVIGIPGYNGLSTPTEVTSITAFDLPDSEDGYGGTAYIVEGVQKVTLIDGTAATAKIVSGGGSAGAAFTPGSTAGVASVLGGGLLVGSGYIGGGSAGVTGGVIGAPIPSGTGGIPTPTAGPLHLAVYPETDTGYPAAAAADAFASLVGYPVTRQMRYGATHLSDGASWAAIAAGCGMLSGGYQDQTGWLAADTANRKTIMSLPILIEGYEGQFTNAALDTYFQQLATNIQATGAAGQWILRPGWEMNIGIGPWGIDYDPDGSGFRAWWNRVIPKMWAIAPNLLFDWCPNSGTNIADFYPSPSLVSFHGIDLYDRNFNGTTDPAGRWDYLLNNPGAFGTAQAFADSQGKQLSVGETSIWSLDGTGGGDDPYFPTHLFQYGKDHGWEHITWFDSPTDTNLLIRDAPQSLAALRAWLRQNG